MLYNHVRIFLVCCLGSEGHGWASFAPEIGGLDLIYRNFKQGFATHPSPTLWEEKPSYTPMYQQPVSFNPWTGITGDVGAPHSIARGLQRFFFQGCYYLNPECFWREGTGGRNRCGGEKSVHLGRESMRRLRGSATSCWAWREPEL